MFTLSYTGKSSLINRPPTKIALLSIFARHGGRFHQPFKPTVTLSVSQVRYYFYFPQSWEELIQRFQSARQERIIKVQFLRDHWRHLARDKRAQIQARGNAFLNRRQNSMAARKVTMKQRRDALQLHVRRKWQDRRVTLADNARSLTEDVRHLWHQTTKQYDQYRLRRAAAKTYTTTHTITEYSEQDWFDADGRPLTSRDRVGRFVNPWQSESTGGLQSLANIIKWRWYRLQREYQQYGWQCVVPKNLRSRQLAMRSESCRPQQHDGLVATEPFLEPMTLPPPPDDSSIKHNQLLFTWIGHSTCLVQQGSIRVLTDPIFSDRSSPWQVPLIGIPRDVPPSCTIAELPDTIDICLLSHDHYDHLDKNSVKQLRHKVGLWIVPLGIAEWLQEKAHIPSHQIVELEWWESVRLKRRRRQASTVLSWKAVEFACLHDGPMHPARLRTQYQRTNSTTTTPTLDQHLSDEEESIWVTCLPAQHWCSRTQFDRNYRLWCSFHVLFPNQGTFYFGGDTALPTDFPLFEQMSDYLAAPIDLAALPIGAYAPEFFMRDAHMSPSEAVRVHDALQVKKSIGIHWGCFPLSEEPMDEPPLLLRAAAGEKDFTTIPFGGTVSVLCSDETSEEIGRGDEHDDGAVEL
jgi:N-acyl-phosphatidylethanolamine-hydrolysing phospholipase D